MQSWLICSTWSRRRFAWKPIPRHTGKLRKCLPNLKVAGVVDGGFRLQSAAFFVILLNARSLAVDTQ